MFFGLFGNRFDDDTFALYRAIVTEARHTEFYLHYGVPDTVSARFDMIVLHMAVLLHRLHAEDVPEPTLPRRRRPPTPHERGQDLIDLFFTDMDRSLREMGIGDVAIPKRIKKLAAAWNGRFRAYDTALATDDRAAFEAAIRRNVLTDVGEIGRADALADHLRLVSAALAGQPIGDVMRGSFVWPAPPVLAAVPIDRPPSA